jgi:DNA polymerase I
LVEEYMRFDSFVFDLETMYEPTPEESERAAALSLVPKKNHSPDDKAWLEVFEKRATDTQANKTIWIGLATYGRSDAVATGHPLGSIIVDQRRVKLPACEAFPDTDPRHFTPRGKPSERAVEVVLPAEFGEPPPQLDIEEAMEIMRPLYFSDRRKVNQNIKFDIKSLVRPCGGQFIPPPYGETMIAQSLLDENAFMQMNLGALVERHLGHKYDKLGSRGVHNFSFEKAARYAEQDAKFTWLLWKRYERMLRKNGLFDLFEFEMDVLDMLMRKEYDGAKIDTSAMAKTRRIQEEHVKGIVDRLICEHGLPPSFNFNSTQQKADLLFSQLGAKVHHTTEGGAPSTDAEALADVVKQGGKAGEVAKLFLEYADYNKNIGTYFVGMGAKIDADAYLHPDFTQHIADTGRISCREPNVHNIPRDSDMRDMFVAPRGQVVIGADYDQIELRGICFYAQDPALRAVFLSGEDVHASTAALVLGKPVAEVSSEERDNFGKMPNFLIGYGGTAWLLASKTGISEKEADHVLASYFRRFSRIEPWKRELLNEALGRATFSEGQLIVPPYVTTMMGRRRRLPDLLLDPKRAPSKELFRLWAQRKGRAERQAANAIIQGSAAETLKIACLDIDAYVRKNKFPMRLALNIHDEIVAYCDERHAEEGLEIVETLMADVVNPFTGEPPLGDYVPLIASGYIADRWKKG